jgi:pimeloyl-ACP methyl ester carboxylesterase
MPHVISGIPPWLRHVEKVVAATVDRPCETHESWMGDRWAGVRVTSAVLRALGVERAHVVGSDRGGLVGPGTSRSASAPSQLFVPYLFLGES